MALDVSFLALVPHKRVDFVSLALLSKGACVLHQRGLAAGHWRKSEGGKRLKFGGSLNGISFHRRHFGASRAHTCSLFAGEGEVVVARHVVPLAVLVPYHDDTVLAHSEEVVRLVGPPVLKLLIMQNTR